jgi:hypothetical protein
LALARKAAADNPPRPNDPSAGIAKGIPAFGSSTGLLTTVFATANLTGVLFKTTFLALTADTAALAADELELEEPAPELDELAPLPAEAEPPFDTTATEVVPLVDAEELPVFLPL